MCMYTEREREREGEGEGEIYFKELTDAVAEAGKSAG